MKAITLYLGLDVHKDSTTIAIAQPGPKGELRLFGTVSSDIDRLEKALRRIGKALRIPHSALRIPHSAFRTSPLGLETLDFGLWTAEWGRAVASPPPSKNRT